MPLGLARPSGGAMLGTALGIRRNLKTAQDALVSRRVSGLEIISSHLILGGLHHHYAPLHANHVGCPLWVISGRAPFFTLYLLRMLGFAAKDQGLWGT